MNLLIYYSNITLEASKQAIANGMTPEILESILNDEN